MDIKINRIQEEMFDFYTSGKLLGIIITLALTSLANSIKQAMDGNYLGIFMGLVTFVLSSCLLYWQIIIRKRKAEEQKILNRRLELENEKLEREAKRQIRKDESSW